VPPVGFEPTISAGERPQTCDLDRAATGIGIILVQCLQLELVPLSCLNLPRRVVAGRGDGLHVWTVAAALLNKVAK
jgi:hypothetical protein